MRYPVYEPDHIHIVQTLVYARYGAAVANGHSHIVGSLKAELLAYLVSHGLFALAEIGIYRGVAVIPAVLVDSRLGKLKGLFIAAVHGGEVSAEHHQLSYLALGSAGGDEDIGLESRLSRVARERRGGVARR